MKDLNIGQIDKIKRLENDFAFRIKNTLTIKREK